MKSEIYCVYCPIYLVRQKLEPDLVAIVEIEHDGSEETLFINNCIIPIITMRNIATPNINNSTISTTSRYRKLYSAKYNTREIYYNIRALLTRLAILKVITWSESFWENMPCGRNVLGVNFSIYLNKNGDHLTFHLDSEIDNMDLDILINIGNIPIVKLNRLSIKESLILFWERHITSADR